MKFSHQPVLVEPIVEALAWSTPIRLMDGTLGGGGHLLALLEANDVPPNKIFAVDQDKEALSAAQDRLHSWQDRIHYIHSNFSRLEARDFYPIDRLLIDLGVSSHQLDTAERGFSFQKEGPLDMRMNPNEGEPVWAYLARCNEKELADILFYYGEEKRARSLASKWVREGQSQNIKTTKAFVEFFGHSLESKNRQGQHPLTRVFQALRIHINQELESLKLFLEKLPNFLGPEGRAAIITFHSLEDRAVKWGLKGRLKAINKKVIQATEDECRENPRARSAKLRLYKKEEGERVN